MVLLLVLYLGIWDFLNRQLWGLTTILAKTFLELTHDMRIFCTPSLYTGIKTEQESSTFLLLVLLTSISQVSAMLLQSNKTGVDDVVQARDDPNLKEDASIRHEQQVGHPGVNVSHTIDYKKTEILSYIKWH